MSRVCILFDRLRTEEKMLRDEAVSMGHETSAINARSLVFGTDGPARLSGSADANIGGVVLERCISYFRGLHATAALEFLGIETVNRLTVASNCGNKMFMSLLLKKNGVPTPETRFAFSAESARKIVQESKRQLVIKPVIGSWGRGIVPLKDMDITDAVLEMREITDGPYDRIFYLQEVVDKPPRDIRVITVGDSAVAAMYRRADGFATNIATGAEPEVCPMTEEIERLAGMASEAVGGGILGVDMIEDPDHGIVVHEVNNTVEFKGISKVAKANIPRAMVEYAVTQLRR